MARRPGTSVSAATVRMQRAVSRVKSGAEGQGASRRRGAADDAESLAVRKKGFVYLVGAGPGDPELLTLKAARLLRQADVCVYDHLVSNDVLALVRRSAELIYAGKEKSNHALPQEDINAVMVALARKGKRVLRLKGGDPFIFGRGGEEMQFLADHDIPFEVVPGVTSASGASTYAGIPLTHRDYAQACVFVTGHLKSGSCELDWEMLARRGQTVVIYMGMGQIEEIFEQLRSHGLPATGRPRRS
ncbi:MAG: uroporphyrinogen-III C-methyltransferase, partial [Gammaproteobacteria bacterium]|nr:uroporphyrinogen-III C-methyltransferase [Gammaproteobacteria bacterium]